MEITEVVDGGSADRYWLENGPPTAVERHMAIRVAERAVIAAALRGGDVAAATAVLRRLLGEGLVDGGSLT